KGIEAGAFENNERMNRLDVVFANRYLEAFEAFRNNQKLSSSWKKAFDCCNKNSTTVFQHLLLGINAHINLDLGIAAALTAPGAAIHSLKQDFDTINKVIGTLVNEVQNELSEINKIMLLIDRVCNDRDEAVANFSIGIARKKAWKFAVALAGKSKEEWDVLIAATDSEISF